jgi:hypothetical protein
MKRNFAHSLVLIFTILIGAAFNTSAQTTVDDLIYGSTNRSVIDINAPATVLLYEPFSYTAPSNLGGQGGWVNQNSGDEVVVTSGSLNYTGLAASQGNKVEFGGAGLDPQKTFTATTTGTVYYSFLLNVTDLGSLNTTGGYVAGLRGGQLTTFGATIWLRAATGGYNIGINPRTTAASTAYSSTVYTANTTYLVVASYQIVSGTGNDVVNLYVNPVSTSFGGTAPATPSATATNTGGTDLTTVDGFFLRQDSTTTTPANLQFDELRVATTYAEVTPAAAAGDTTPPTVSSIVRASTNPTTSGSSVDYTVTFSESVTGVDATDFVLTTSGVTGASITNVTGSGSTYTVTVNVGSGSGTVRLDVADNDSIVDAAGNPLGGTGAGNGSFTGGEVYTVNAPATPGTVQFSSATYGVGEAAGTVTLTVTRTGGSSGAVTVNYTLGGGSATGGACGVNGADYNNTSGSVTFNDGDAADKTFTVAICNDSVFEGSETFNATLSIGSGSATLGTPNPATVTITDGQTQPTLSIGNVTQNEGNAGTTTFNFPVTLSGASSQTVTVNYTTSDGTATVADNDYVAVASGTITFAPGETSKTAPVTVNGDTKVESNETFTVALSNPSQATINQSPGTGTITNDDSAASGVTITPTTVNVTEGGATAIFSVVLNSQPTSDVFINAQPDSQITLSAVACPQPTRLEAPKGFAPGSVQLTFTPANYNTPQCVRVTAVDDTAVEGNHTGSVSFFSSSSDSNYNNISISPLTANITDNDTAQPTVTLSQPACNGLVRNPVPAGSQNDALLCFTLTASGTGANFTGLTVQFSSDPSVKFTNPRLYRSGDTDYSTTGDNTLIATGTVNSTSFVFTGFTASPQGENGLIFGEPKLAAGANNFFVVADVLPTVNSSTPATQPSISPSNITITGGTVDPASPSATGTNYVFGPAVPTAATTTVGGRVMGRRGIGVEGATVTMTDSEGGVRTAYTDEAGNYRFTEVQVGQTLVFTARARGLKFRQPTQSVYLTEELMTVNFTTAVSRVE